MNAARIVDQLSAAALEIDWFVRELTPTSDYGRRAFASLEPFTPGQEDEAHARALRVAAIATKLDAQRLSEIQHVLRGAPDALPVIARVAVGDALSDADFLIALRFCDAFARLRTLVSDAGDAVPANDDAALRSAAAALERGRSGKSGFYLGDDLHPALGGARAAERAEQEAFDLERARIVSAVECALNRQSLEGEFIVLRADAPAALPADVRVIREAPTYLLCEIELDDAALEALRARDAAAAAVASLEEATRGALTATLREHADGLERAAQWIGQVDVLTAAARFTQANACEVAQIEPEPTLALEGARYLPLAHMLASEGRAYAPIDVDLAGVSVLTGPNMGGKSAALRTCGTVAFCAAFGVPVPAMRARVALFERIAWVGIGAQEPEGGGLLSAFAREVVRLRELLSTDTKRTLVLADEFARTTTPQEGRALLVALIERLRDGGGCAFMATHLAGVAQATGARHVAVRGLRGIPRKPDTADLDRALAVLAESMDYTLTEVGDDAPVSADALALASLLGLDDALIEAARRAL